MERLLSSSSSSPTNPVKFNLKASPFLPRLARFDSPRLAHFPSPSRLSSISSRSSFRSSNCSSSSSSPFSSLSSSEQACHGIGSVSEPETLKRVSIGDSEKRKAFFTAGTYIMLSALAVILIQPMFAPAALATFQTAAKTGGSAATGLFRTELLSSAWTGFFAGCLHTLSGPDHLAALAPLSIGRSPLESAAVGALWGCGHDAGQLLFGLLFLILKDRLHIEVIRTWGTRVVGLTLLAIGFTGIREASEAHAPVVALETDLGVSNPLEGGPGNSQQKKKKKIGFATFATGIVHGLQPDALMIILPALALPSRVAGAAFLGMFLVGTVVAMGSYTVFLGSCSEALKDRVPRITEKLTWAASIFAIGLGLAIILSQFFGYSLY